MLEAIITTVCIMFVWALWMALTLRMEGRIRSVLWWAISLGGSVVIVFGGIFLGVVT